MSVRLCHNEDVKAFEVTAETQVDLFNQIAKLAEQADKECGLVNVVGISYEYTDPFTALVHVS